MFILTIAAQQSSLRATINKNVSLITDNSRVSVTIIQVFKTVSVKF